MLQLNSVLTTILIMFATGIYGECDRDTGPAGSPECVLLEPSYHKYQWATCLTNQYIQTYSKGKHFCADNYATYCYYQCMIEVHHDGGQASSSEYNLNDNKNETVNVSVAARDAAYAIQQGDVHFAIDEGLKLTQLNLCVNYNCSETSLQVKPAETSNDSIPEDKGMSKSTIIIIVCVSVFGIALLSSIIIILRKTNKC